MAAGNTIMTEVDGAEIPDADLETLQSPPDPQPQRQARGRPSSPPEPDLVAVDDADLAALQPPSEPAQETEREPSVAGDSQEQTYLDEQRRRGTEPKRARRERQARAKEHRYHELDFLRRRVNELEEQVQGIEPRLSGFDQAQVAQQVSQLERDINGQAHLANDARRRLAEAVTNADPEQLNRALEDRDRAIMLGQQLTVRRNLLTTGDPLGAPQQGQRQQQQRQPAQQQQQQQPARLSSEVQNRVDDFMAEHPWYNPHDARNTDSRVILQIDNALANEGFLPDTDAYWDEMDARARKYVPWRFEEEGAQEVPAKRNGNGAARPQQRQPAQQQQQQQQPQLRGPAIGTPPDRGPQLKSNQVYISPDRKQAMILAGALDSDGRTVTNPAKYKGLLKQYADYDRANSVARQ